MGGGSGSGGGTGSSYGFPIIYTWQNLLPPWTRAGQEKTVPMLQERVATGGMTPYEERNLWSGIRETTEQGSDLAGRNYMKNLSASGISPNSPAAAGGATQLALERMTGMSKAAMDFAKMKLGARDTAVNQLLTALYTQPPSASGQYTSSQQSSGGGGK